LDLLVCLIFSFWFVSKYFGRWTRYFLCYFTTRTWN
jgi:hypothetical protein